MKLNAGAQRVGSGHEKPFGVLGCSQNHFADSQELSVIRALVFRTPFKSYQKPPSRRVLFLAGLLSGQNICPGTGSLRHFHR